MAANTSFGPRVRCQLHAPFSYGRARRLRRFPNRVRVGRGLYRLGKRDRRLVGIRKGKVRFVAVASRRVLAKRSRKALRTYVRRAGFR